MNQDEFQAHVIAELGYLRGQMTAVAGNGQPGRLGRVEQLVAEYGQRIERAEGQARLLKWIAGIMVAGWGTVKLIFQFRQH